MMLRAATMLVFAFAFWWSVQQSQAQDVVLPGAADPARFEAPDIEDEDDDFEFELDFSISVAEGCTPPVGSEDEEIDFEGLTLEGNSVLGNEELQPFWADFLGETITMTDLYSICEKVSRAYQEKGWMLSWALFPAQDVDDGVYRLRVIEGFIDEVVIESADGNAETPIRNKQVLQDLFEPVTHFRPTRIDILERYLMLAYDYAGVRVTSVLRPSSETQGATRLTLQVTETPYNLTYLTNNRGSKFAGPWTHTLSGTVNSAFGKGESITVTAVGAWPVSEQKFVSVGGKLPVGREGSAIAANASYSVSEPGFTLRSLGIKSVSKTADVSFSHGFIRSIDETLNGNVKLAWSASKSDLATGVVVSDDNLLRASATADYTQSGWFGGVNSFSATYTQPLPFAFTSDPDKDTVSRADANRWAPKLNLNAAHIQQIDGWLLTAKGTAQLAHDSLFSGDEFGVGGEAFGRAYVASEITGDYGYALSGEISRALPLQDWLPADLPEKWQLLDSVQGYGFIDGGHTWNYQDDSGNGSRKLASAGLGLRSSHPGGVSFYGELAQPFIKDIETHHNEKPLRWFMGLTVSW